MPTAARITDGDYAKYGLSADEGVSYWACKDIPLGLLTSEPELVGGGLPIRGSNIDGMVCKYVERIKIIKPDPPCAAIYRAYATSAFTFPTAHKTTRLSNYTKEMLVPSWKLYTASVGPTAYVPNHFYVDRLYYKRCFQRIVNSLSETEVMNFDEQNTGKLYQFNGGGSPYWLYLGTECTFYETGQALLSSEWWTNSAFKAYTGGTLAERSISLPILPRLAEYVVNYSTGTPSVVTNAATLNYDFGAALPW